jgi:hypothetical protein
MIILGKVRPPKLIHRYRSLLRVIDRWRVVDPADGTGHVKDDVLVVPERVAQEWERCGYVERVTGKS